MLAVMAAKRRRVGKAFGIALREARLKSGVTQEELAGRANYSTVLISLLENGHRQPTISALISIEDALGLQPGELTRQTKVHLRATR